MEGKKASGKPSSGKSSSSRSSKAKASKAKNKSSSSSSSSKQSSKGGEQDQSVADGRMSVCGAKPERVASVLQRHAASAATITEMDLTDNGLQ